MVLHKQLIKHGLFPLMEKLKGNKIRYYIKDFQQTEKYTPEQLHTYRSEKLAKLLKHAVSSVPAYENNQHLLRRINENPIEALQHFPILTKKHFNDNRDQYVSTQVDKGTLISNRTGGSTGRPISFYMDRYTVENYEAARWRGLSWHGIHIGDPSVMVWGSPIELSQSGQKKYELKERLLKNRILISAYELNKASVKLYVERITTFKPAYLYGYASALFMLAKLIKEEGLYFKHHLKGIVSTAETLFDEQRVLLEDVFQCPIIDEYGARDGGIIAFQCTKGQMHIQAENLWLEVVDMVSKEPVEVGKEGLLIVTDLNNLAMPRLRYEIGDYGALSHEHCDCGLGLPILNNIEGRAEEFFVTKQGELIHGHFIAHIIRNLNGIEHYQAIQHNMDHLTLKVVLKSSGDEANGAGGNGIVSTIDSVEADVATLLGKVRDKMQGTHITLERVDHIPLSPSGKVRNSIREFEL